MFVKNEDNSHFQWIINIGLIIQSFFLKDYELARAGSNSLFIVPKSAVRITRSFIW